MRPGLLRAAALVVLVAVAFAGWRWWRSDERRLRLAFDELLSAVEKKDEESSFDRLGHARSFARLFAQQFVVSAKPYAGTLSDRQELMGVLDGYRSNARTVSATSSDLEITLRDNGTADLYAVIELNGAYGSGPGRERFRLRLAWVKEDGEWRISEGEILERLESSGLF